MITKVQLGGVFVIAGVQLGGVLMIMGGPAWRGFCDQVGVQLGGVARVQLGGVLMITGGPAWRVFCDQVGVQLGEVVYASKHDHPSSSASWPFFHSILQDSYPSIFGYMEDLYHAHEQLWTCTFEPCLNKVKTSNKRILFVCVHYGRGAVPVCGWWDSECALWQGCCACVWVVGF